MIAEMGENKLTHWAVRSDLIFGIACSHNSSTVPLQSNCTEISSIKPCVKITFGSKIGYGIEPNCLMAETHNLFPFHINTNPK